MQFRVVTLNLEQDHKRWPARQPLIEAELARLRPDIVALNEVSVPLQTAQLLRKTLSSADAAYSLVQQTKVNSLSKVEAEAMLSRFPLIESGNLDYQAGDMVALVARVAGHAGDLDDPGEDLDVAHLLRRGHGAVVGGWFYPPALVLIARSAQTPAWSDGHNEAS